MLYRFHSWGAFPEVLGAILAQAETIFEKVNKTAETFGAGDDHFRLGMVIVFGAAVLLIGNYIAFKLFIALLNSTIKDLQGRNGELEKEIRANRTSYDVKYEELRVSCDKKCEAYLGTMNYAVAEMAQVKAVLQGMGVLQRGQDHPQISIPPTPQPLPSKANFMPARRPIARRVEPPKGE